MADEPARRSDTAAVQFMILDFLQEILSYSESPGEMGRFLTRQLRELMGVRTVLLLQHDHQAKVNPMRIVALEPERAQNGVLLPCLVELLRLHPNTKEALFFLRASAPLEVGTLMDRLGVASVSLTPLWVGEIRVGSLVALDHLDFHRTDDVVRLLQALSPVFALILRNTLFYESQEAKVLAQADNYRALLEAHLDGYVVVGSGGRLLDANAAYLRMTGYSLDELKQHTLADLEARETSLETEAHTEKVKRQGADRFLSWQRREDGRSFPVEVSTTYVASQDIVIGFIRDLTAQVAAESALRQSEAQHRELVEILGEGVSVADPGATFTMANPEAERIFGVGPGDLVGRNLRTFTDDAEWQQVLEHASRRTKGSVDAYQLRIRRPDGEGRTLQVTATPRMDSSGRYTGSLSVFRDITEELNAQETLRLRQKMESLGYLAGGVAHDMNNVLSAILGLASAHAEVQPEGSPLQAALETITKACFRGRNMVKSLLDFARKDMTGERPLALNTLVREEAKLLERVLPANISIGMELEPGLESILGVPDALSLTLMNLCVNAADAMPQGGEILLSTKRLPNDQVLLSVQDSGTGMPPEVLEHALDPFFTTKPQGKGTGLGLAQAYSTVKAHHGDLRIQSIVGQGTTIHLQFPCAIAQAETVAPPPAKAAPCPESFRILLVDDDDLIQSSMAMQLETLGHHATVAASGEAAMELVEQGLRPDIVILDMNMPGWGGVHTLPRLREVLPDVPILLSTGRLDQQAAELSRGYTRVAVLPKPFGFQELSAAFAELRSFP